MASLLLALIYVCFISLGLPDSLLGSAWPVLHQEIDVPTSFAGIVSTVICLGTIMSSLLSGKLLAVFRAGKLVAVSVALTAVGLFGFSVSGSFAELIIWSIPYGLGAGGVDAVLNNYVALHYKAQHMSWLHCMWGVGAAISPYVMSFSLLRLKDWSRGYLIVSIIQVILAVIIFISLPVWRKMDALSGVKTDSYAKSYTFKEVFSTPGAPWSFMMFLLYCSLELTTSLWASSYLVERWNMPPEPAAGLASMFYIGMTVGRFLNGFLAMRISDKTLIRVGISVVFLGVLLLALPVSSTISLVGFVVIGLGCAPIYPCIIHMTPDVFGKEKSQGMIGVQMAFAYSGFVVAPPLFGFISGATGIGALPAFLMCFLLLIAICYFMIFRSQSRKNTQNDN